MSQSEVSRITPHVRLLEAPTDLRKLQAWILWRYEQDPNEPKPRKVPYWASGQRRFGQNGSPLDRAKLVTFDAAREAAARRGFDGVGFCPLPEWGITALDFDRCLDDRGQPPPEVLEIVGKTYAELSPSGTGLRAFVRGNLGNHKNLKTPGGEWGFETFATAGYVTFTGNPFWTTEMLSLENTIRPADAAVEALCLRCFGSREAAGSVDPLDLLEPRLGLPVAQLEAYLSDLDPSMGRDPWIRVGMALHHECEGDDTGFTLWDEWSSAGAQYPGSEALQSQWDSFTRREGTMRPVTAASLKKLSNDARAEQGLEPRVFDPLDKFKDAPAPTGAPGDPVATPDVYTGKFPIVSGYAFAQRDPPEWIIKGVLPMADLGVLYGASGSGKSFIALDMSLAIARGVDWRGRKVRQKRVLYLAAEGGGGVAMRLRAYADHNMLPLEHAPLGVMHGVPNLMDLEDVAEVLESIQAAGGVDLIVIDTFAQVTAGANENAGEDMGKALNHARRIREMTGAMVLLIHHSGKDASRGARGWSGIRAAADVEMEVVRPEEGDVRLLRVSKQKDGDDDVEWGFTLEKVQIGLDSDGDPLTSLVVLPAEAPDRESMTAKRAPQRGPLIQALCDFWGQIDIGAEPLTLAAFAYGAADMLADGFGSRAEKASRLLSLLSLPKTLEDVPFVLEHGLVKAAGTD